MMLWRVLLYLRVSLLLVARPQKGGQADKRTGCTTQPDDEHTAPFNDSPAHRAAWDFEATKSMPINANQCQSMRK